MYNSLGGPIRPSGASANSLYQLEPERASSCGADEFCNSELAYRDALRRRYPAFFGSSSDHPSLLRESVLSMVTASKRKNEADSAHTSNKRTKEDPIPVTILSGFLGSGKTTLLQHILTSPDHQLKIAVIVNDMAELNVDGHTILRASDIAAPKKVVTLENGCICCTLRGDLVREIAHIRATNQFDYVLIESTGIAEPQQVAESFCVDPETEELAQDDDRRLLESSRLDTCVTVVDAVHFPGYLSSLKRFQDVFRDGLDDAEEGEGEKSISELMVEQVEFANVIILNKIDLASAQQVETARKLIAALNPRARVITGSFGKVDLHHMLNTRLFNIEEASESPGWLVSLKDGVKASHGEADEYGVSSFVYRRRRPFHPLRLHTFLSRFFCFAEDWNSGKMDMEEKQDADTNTYGTILRSKGTCWIAGKDEHEMSWAQTGRIIQVTPTCAWFCTKREEQWDGADDEEEGERIKTLFQETPEKQYDYGDRRQELVFIGTDLKQKEIKQGLDECLLDDTEFKNHTAALPIGAYADPMAPILEILEGSSTFFMILRPGTRHHFRVCQRFKSTIQSLALNIRDESVYQDVRAVKVWLDKTDKTDAHGLLLATLRPDRYEQHSMALEMLSLDEYVDEKGTSRKLRLEVMANSNEVKWMEKVEVHVMGATEPLPYFQAEDYEDDEESEDDDHDGDCPDGNCPLEQ